MVFARHKGLGRVYSKELVGKGFIARVQLSRIGQNVGCLGVYASGHSGSSSSSNSSTRSDILDSSK